MIYSRYNFLWRSEQFGYMIYNSLTNCFAQIEKDIFEMLSNVKLGKEINLESIDEETLDIMNSSKIFVESDDDELLSLKFKKYSHRFNQRFLSLTIAPTLDCNFKCSYCFEDPGKKNYMSLATENKLIDFIKKFNNLDFLHVSWYGGEPLMAEKTIQRLTKSLINFGLNYSASITTNGYLLNKKFINQLESLRINDIQVTIDGPEEIHNARRPHKNRGGSFNTIIDNLHNLSVYKKDKRIAIKVRVNIDTTNEQCYADIYNYIKNIDKSIYVYPGFVQEVTTCQSNRSCNLDRFRKASFKISNFKERSILDEYFYPRLSGSECMARHINSFLIGPEGEVYKCWSDVGQQERVIGSITDDSITNFTLMTRYILGADPFDNKDCKDCFFLPICGGGCPYFALKNHYEDGQYDICYIAKDCLQEFLELHYEKKMKAGDNLNLIASANKSVV